MRFYARAGFGLLMLRAVTMLSICAAAHFGVQSSEYSTLELLALFRFRFSLLRAVLSGSAQPTHPRHETCAILTIVQPMGTNFELASVWPSLNGI
jgi:hypothetical protein